MTGNPDVSPDVSPSLPGRTADALRAHREAAAQASAGISSDGIHEAFERLVPRLGLEGDVLDYGAGIGNLGRSLHAMGTFRSISAVDIMSRPDGVPEAIRWSQSDLNDPTSFPDASFDAVMSAEVIEHLENPRAVAREWFRLLRPGGAVLMSTPNNESLRALISLVARGHFVSFTGSSYPAHITALLRKDLSRVLVEAGFQAPEFFFTDSGGIPGRPIVRWQSISPRVFKGMWFSDNVLAFARKPQ
jgi:2-polyprenyl-3-methyl-5-hydroxy-6-metoxy-1,4-benzoquinol methylase